MRFRLNSSHMKFRRKDLRKHSTLAECKLWEELRKSKLGVKFFRQYSFDNYVVDFYCPKYRLGVELFGEIHNKSEIKVYDKYREKYLKAFGIKIVSFTNEEVEDDIGTVVEKIKKGIIEK